MAAKHTSFVCAQCGAVSSKWLGRCPSCRAWDSMVEEAPQKTAKYHRPPALPTPLSRAARGGGQKSATGLSELDRVLGGGLTPGMVVLLGGEPGIGKSTLMLQLADSLGRRGLAALYASAEESAAQVGQRAGRMGLASDRVMVLAETGLNAVLDAARAGEYAVVIMDSIQAVRGDAGGSPGSVSQVRYCAAELAEFAKAGETALFLVGHVTKEGVLAGPRVLEHLVDTVLYFESEPFMSLRLLRSQKNRFGATDEIGVFEMGEMGLTPVSNPSAAFLANRSRSAPGSVVCAAVSGSRPILVEIQALVSPSGLAMPRRQALGVDQGRLHMIAAVLSIHAGLDLSGHDIFINVTGGMRLGEPAADLAVAAAMASSFHQRPLPPDLVCFGEIGLTGELRRVSRPEARQAEAARQGFTRALTAPAKKPSPAQGGLLAAGTLAQALDLLWPGP